MQRVRPSTIASRLTYLTAIVVTVFIGPEMMRHDLRLFPVVAALAAERTAATPSARQGGQPKPTFRTVVALVPVDVRVIDNRTGKPVTDLRQEDFTLLEDGVRQEVKHFVNQPLMPDPARSYPLLVIPDAAAKRAVWEQATAISPQTRRVFLIVLGNGRLQGPSKGLDALLSFVRDRLLPQDQVAVFAYDRATDFTANHEQVVQVIERFREDNGAITAEIDQQFSGLAAVYGSQELPDSVQARVDKVFGGSDMLKNATVGRAENAASGDRTRRDARQRGEAALDAVVASGRLTPQADSALGPQAALSWSTFDNFVAANAQTLRDMGNLYAAIAYMREIEGEKHLIFVTEQGMHVGRREDEQDLAVVASDGRVAIDVIQTGGLDPSEDAMFARQGLRAIAEATGGTSSICEAGSLAFERLDSVTRNTYVLGYYPSNTKWDAAYRKIEVKVNRRDVTILSRDGYHSFTTVAGFDRQEYITRHRIEGAAAFPKDVTDIHVKLKASFSVSDGQPTVMVDALIDPSHLYYTIRKSVRLGRIVIAVLAMDGERSILGGTYKKQVAHLEYDKPTFDIVKKKWIPYQVRMRVPVDTRYVRVVVYDYMMDLVGTAGTWVY
ncbi:MAG: VWA domain-containing protein [Acidobacteria bacterium]|nr:VWA domain-containing protein [Acidobacteriota bacterium]